MSFLLSQPAGLCGLLLASLVQGVAASSVDMAYCASINTASTSGNSSIYQSDGLCYNFCIDDYAYAIVHEYNCWCSDYTPGSDSTVDTSECDISCPGYPSDVCGGDDLYGYMALTKSPSGTKSASTAASTGSSSSSSSSTTTSETTTTTSPSSSSSSSSSSTSTTTSSSTESDSKSSTSSSSDSQSSSTSLSIATVTTGGVVQTVTVTPTPSGSAIASTSTQSKGVSTGTAVGVAVGVVAGVVGIVGVVLFLWRRKRQQQNEKDEALFSSGTVSSTRGTSPGTLNAADAVGSGSLGRRNGDGSWESDQSGRRRSTLMPIDPRIDPAFSDIYSRSENKSRDSINSLRDDHDYSRRVHQPTKVLRATNPDPDVD